jgi:general stress protein YciG
MPRGVARALQHDRARLPRLQPARPILGHAVIEEGEAAGRLVAPQHHAARRGGQCVGEWFGGAVSQEEEGLRAGRIAAAELLLQGGEQGAHRRQCRRLAARRAANQRLPQHQRLGPGGREADDGARAAEAGHRGQQGLRDVGAGRARADGRVGNPAAPWLR